MGLTDSQTGFGVLDFETKKSAIVVNNLDWTSGLTAIEFLRDISKHFSVNQMLAKSSLSTVRGWWYFLYRVSYQVLQSYDYLELFRRNNCTLQLGSSDQWEYRCWLRFNPPVEARVRMHLPCHY